MRTSLSLLAILTLLMVSACGSTAKEAPKAQQPAAPSGGSTAPAAGAAPSPAKKDFTVALVVKNVVNPFWKLVRLGAEQAAKEAGIKLVHAAPTKPDNLDESIQIMEDLITKYKAKAVDAVVFVAVDYKAMVPVVGKANQAGLPIFNYSNRLAAGGKYVSFIG